MLRYVLRRAFWTLPSLVLATMLLFVFLARLPAARVGGVRDESIALPLFINLSPRDVRSAAEAAAMQAARDESDARARAELVRLGGAALPHVLPLFDALPPQERERLALSLLPVAVRMGLLETDSGWSGTEAEVFWTRTWAERSVDFTPAVARRAVVRLAAHGSQARRAELIELDTFALPWLLDALRPVDTPEGVARAARIVEIASHATGRDACLSPSTNAHEANRCIARWRAWWLHAGTGYTTLTGADRVASMLVETRYGRWAMEAVVLRLGDGSDGVPVADRLWHEGTRTAALAGSALLLAYALGIPLGLMGAWRHRRVIDGATGAAVLLLYATPWPLIAWFLWELGSRGWAAGVLATALALVGAPSRQQRVATLDTLRSEAMRAARAKGLHPVRLVLVHGARDASVIALAVLPLDFPLALSGACVVEHAFGLRGMGQALVVAANVRDVPFLMASGLAMTAINAVLLILSDAGCAWLDPRVRRALAREPS